MWQEPPDVKEPFTVTLEIAGPFKVETKPFVINEMSIQSDQFLEDVKAVPSGQIPVKNWVAVLIIVLSASTVALLAKRKMEKSPNRN